MKKQLNPNNLNNQISNVRVVETKYEELFEAMGHGVVHHDSKAEIIDANPAACKLLGLNVSQLKGRTPSHPEWRVITAEGAPFPGNLHPASECLRTGQQVRDVVMGVYHPEKKEFVWLLVNAEPIFESQQQNKLIGILTTFTDITTRINLEKDLRQQHKLQELLTKISRTFININLSNIDFLINNTLAELGHFFEVDRLYIFDYDFETSTTSNTYEWCAAGIEPQITELQQVPIAYFPDWVVKHQKGQSMIINDVEALDKTLEVYEILSSQDIKSLIAVPLMDGNKCLGFIGIDAVRTKHTFSESEQSWLNVFADILVNVFYRIQGEQNLKQTNENLKERHKELTCVYNVLKINQIEKISIDEYFQKVAEIIPTGFLLDQNVSARICHKYKFYQSPNFKQTSNKIEISINSNNQQIAILEIYNAVGVAFLEEEKLLIESIKRNIELRVEKKLAREDLQKSEEKYKIIANNTYHWEFWNNANNHFIYHSPACEKVIGYTADELLNNQSLFTNAIHPDDIEAFVKHHQNVNQQREAEKHFFKLISKNGELKYIEHVCQPVYDENNKYLGRRGTNIDITNRKKAEEEIYKFRVISDQAYFGSAIIDLDNKVTYCNDAFAKMHGYETQELIGKDIFTFHTNSQIPLVNDAVNSIKTEGGFLDLEIPHVTKNGHVFPTLMSARLIKLDDAIPAFVSVTVVDISEKKKAENEISKFRIVADQANYGVGISDLDGVLEYCNPIFAQMHGWEQQELIGKHVSIFYEKKEKSDEIFNEIKQLGGFISKEVTRKRKDNSTFPSFMNAKIIGNENSMQQLISLSIIDITEHKKYQQEIIDLNQNLEKKIEERTKELAKANFDLTSEIETRKKVEMDLIVKSKELETFFTVAIDLLCIASIDGKFIKLNKAWENTLGYSNNELENKFFMDYVHPDDTQITQDALEKLSDQNPILKFVNRYKTKQGDYRFIEWHSVPVGQFIYCAARDITERMTYEEELLNARSEAEVSNRSKSDFLSKMSHELRTPMNSILGFAQLLEMSNLTASQQKGVNHILKSGKHLLDLINEILDISKIEAGKISISLEPVNLTNIIHEVIELMLPFANKLNIAIINNIVTTNAPICVMADRQRLKQVIINFVNNAIKYNREGGSVWIFTELTKSENSDTEHIKITIKDNGIGIANSDLERIFMPFERVGVLHNFTEGTGLGLAVAKQLVNLMQGNIGVESELNIGSKFWVELPSCLSPTEQATLSGNLTPIEKTETEIKGSILYIEDNYSNIELVTQIIENRLPNIKLYTCTNGKQAAMLAKQIMPNLILLDLHLPDLHGSDVFKNLLLEPTVAKIPVIVVSADAMPKQIDEMYHLGIKKYLTKPIDVPELLTEINKYIL